MEDLIDIEKCWSISELFDGNKEDIKKVNDKFDSMYEKVSNEGDNFEAIVSVNKASKTAVITPLMRKNYLVDYESSDSEMDTSVVEEMKTPHANFASKTPKLKRQRDATPHVKKFLKLMRQRAIEEYEEAGEENMDRSSVTKTTPLRNENDEGNFMLIQF